MGSFLSIFKCRIRINLNRITKAEKLSIRIIQKYWNPEWNQNCATPFHPGCTIRTNSLTLRAEDNYPSRKNACKSRNYKSSLPTRYPLSLQVAHNQTSWAYPFISLKICKDSWHNRVYRQQQIFDTLKCSKRRRFNFEPYWSKE